MRKLVFRASTNIVKRIVDYQASVSENLDQLIVVFTRGGVPLTVLVSDKDAVFVFEPQDSFFAEFARVSDRVLEDLPCEISDLYVGGLEGEL